VNNKKISEVPEVEQFEQAQHDLLAFVDQHPKLFTAFNALAEDYNQKLEVAEKLCRQQQISCGPFDLYQQQETYDAQALYDAVGEAQFLGVGGLVATQTVYKVDKQRLQIAIAQKHVTEKVVEAILKVSPRFHKPTKLSLL